jgi:hypothetical protein
VTRQKLQLFLERWKKAVGNGQDGKNRITGYWEGKQAYDELKATGFLKAVNLEEPLWEPDQLKPKDWRAREAIQDICALLRLYHDHAGKVVELNARYREGDRFLKLMLLRFEKKTQALAGSNLEQTLRECADDIDRHRRKLEEARLTQIDRVWEHPPGVMGRIRIAHTYKKRPVREDHLDTLFQTQLALVLRTYLPKAGYVWVPKRLSKKARRVFRKKEGISRRTIARLVVLTYIVAGLVRLNRYRGLQLRYTGDKLRVPNVEQTLKRARSPLL